MTKARGRQRNDRGRVDMSQPVPPGRNFRPPEFNDASVVKEGKDTSFVWYGTSGIHEYRTSIREVRIAPNQPKPGMLVDFACTISTREIGQSAWTEVVRVDHSHGYLHSHEFLEGAGDHNTNVVPASLQNLDQAFRWALAYIEDIAEGYDEVNDGLSQ